MIVVKSILCRVKVIVPLVFALVLLCAVSATGFAANEVYAVQEGTVYYSADATGTKLSSATQVSASSITHLFVGEGVTSIATNAFKGCTSLVSVDLSKATSLTVIYGGAFSGCTNLQTVLLPSSLKTVQTEAFYGATSLLSIDFSGTQIQTIASEVFQNCTALQTVTFGSGTLQSIGSQVFYNCTSLKSIDLSKETALTEIPYQGFYNCKALASISLPSSISIIDEQAFYKCSALTSLALAHTAITSLPTKVLSDATALKTVTFPSGLKTIESYAFSGCTSLDLQESLKDTALTTIGNDAFSGCTSIVRVVLPSSVSSIQARAFYGCSSFGTLSLGATPPTVTSSTFTGCAFTNVLVIDSTAITTYKAVADGNTSDYLWYGWTLMKTDVSINLVAAIDGWVYGEVDEPDPSLTKDGTAQTSYVTYLYATSEDGTYVTADELPRSSAGEIVVGTYWLKAVYSAPLEEGDTIVSFEVTPKTLTVEVWTSGVSKEYDGTTDIEGLSPSIYLDGEIDGDDVSASANYAYTDANAGDSKTISATGITLTGDDKDNYVLDATSKTGTGAQITKKIIVIEPPTASDIYKGETLEASTLTAADAQSSTQETTISLFTLFSSNSVQESENTVSYELIDGELLEGVWYWVDSSIAPDETDMQQAVFVPTNSDNYEMSEPVDVQVRVLDALTSGDSNSGTVLTIAASGYTAPQTGDETNLTLYRVLSMLSMVGIVGCTIWIYKHRDDENDTARARAARAHAHANSHASAGVSGQERRIRTQKHR